ncbi:hypothetical protein PTTG_10744 [Puccinia triticina 1-1 BBBD Race 1]|uniref:Uncharacterized protein n=1 Tax=Puccinia triticina (isolate 1-1 / race 1 (BBBD)) TaxID=630390 RepID=A0A180G0G5_PUCT1|nr:hypothetical protein PTTG_10744 [Puccinia triticina 1-1 BBBD Race 1]
MAHQSVISISPNSASPTDSIEILSSPLSSLSSSSLSDPPASPADSNPSPQYSLPDYEEGDAAVEDQSPSSPCTLEREISEGGSPVYLPTMAVDEGSVGSDDGIPLSHMVYLEHLQRSGGQLACDPRPASTCHSSCGSAPIMDWQFNPQSDRQITPPAPPTTLVPVINRSITYSP